MTISADVFDGRSNVYRWDVNTLAWIVWDGSLATGALTIGTVNQGTGGVSAWKVDGSAVTQPVSVAGAVPVTGTFWQATQPVSGTFYQATQPVSGPLTDTQLRAVAVPVSGTVAVTSGTLATEATLSALNTKVTAVNTGAVVVSSSALPSGASTAALQTQPGVDIGDVTVNNAAGASAVNIQDGGNTITVDGTVAVSGSVAVTGPLTDTQLRAAAVPVSLASAPTTAVTNAGLTNLDVALSTRLKPTDTLTGVTTVTSVTNLAGQATSYGKTLTYVPVAQGAAGTTVLAAANVAAKHKIIGCLLTMSAAGTLKFLDGAGDLTGAMDVGATGGFVLPAALLPYQQTATNSALSITTTGGAAKGVVTILTEA